MALDPAMTERDAAYRSQRAWIAEHFERSAARWAVLTSVSPVNRIRASVRRGRDQMRATLLGWLPDRLDGLAVLDAGCGTGSLAIEASRRGAQVLGVDLSPGLIQEARSRAAAARCDDRLRFRVGDMLDVGDDHYDYVVAMDSLIHYQVNEAIRAVARLAAIAHRGVLFTIVPGTPLLRALHRIGRLLPSSNRAPAVHPVSESAVRARLESHPSALRRWQLVETVAVKSGFYTSQAYRLAPR